MTVAADTNTSSGRLLDRLPRLTANEVETAQTLFKQPLEFAIGEDWRARFAFDPQPLNSCRCVIDLKSDDDTIELGLGLDRVADPLGDQQWEDFDWRSRLLAWSSAHQKLLDGLEELFGALLPVRLKTPQTASTNPERSWLSLAIVQQGQLLVTGAIGLPPSFVSALLLRRQTDLGRDCRALPIKLRAVVRGPRFQPERIAALNTGDVLVLGTHEQAFQAVNLCQANQPGRIAQGQWHHDGIRILGAAIEERTNHGETAMTQTENTASDQIDIAGKLPVSLDFELGQVSVTVAELQRLQAGYVFELPQPIEGASVTIRANDQAIGRGELVAAGDTLGVRVLSWDEDGLQ